MIPAQPGAVALAWDPAQHDRWNGGFRRAAEAVASRGRAHGLWPAGGHRLLPAGTDVWFFFGGSRPGLAGHGATSAVPGVDDAGRWQVTVTADSLLDAGDQLPAEEVLRETGWRQVPPSGSLLQAADTAVLRRLWQAHLPGHLRPDPLLAVPGSLQEEAIRHAAVDRWEHDPDIRRLCLGYHGTSCAACGFSFEQTYGTDAAGYLQVHRLEASGGGTPDPVTDMVPLCPNCHAVTHLAHPALTPAELRRMMGAHGHLAGEALDDRQLTARSLAHRLLHGGEAKP